MNFWLAVVAGWIVPGSGNVWHVQNWTPPRAGLRGQKPSHGYSSLCRWLARSIVGGDFARLRGYIGAGVGWDLTGR